MESLGFDRPAGFKILHLTEDYFLGGMHVLLYWMQSMNFCYCHRGSWGWDGEHYELDRHYKSQVNVPQSQLHVFEK